MYSAVNPQHLQILRIDRQGMIDDIMTHSTWHHLCKKYSLTLSSLIRNNTKCAKKMLITL